MTRDELLSHITLLETVASGRFDSLDLRPLALAIANRWIGVKVTDRGALEVHLTQAGRNALAKSKVSV